MEAVVGGVVVGCVGSGAWVVVGTGGEDEVGTGVDKAGGIVVASDVCSPVVTEL